MLTPFVPFPEILQTQLLDRFSQIIVEAQGVHRRHLDVLKTRVDATEVAAKGLNSEEVQRVFIGYNIRDFSPPPDVKFEACPTYYDTVSLAPIAGSSPDDTYLPHCRMR